MFQFQGYCIPTHTLQQVQYNIVYVSYKIIAKASTEQASVYQSESECYRAPSGEVTPQFFLVSKAIINNVRWNLSIML